MLPMRYRRLGRTRLEVSEIGFGAWGIGGKQWLGGDDRSSMEAIERAFELGLNFVDTALAYGDGHSEQLVGQAVRNAPHPVVVATKIPPKNRIWPATSRMPADEVYPYDYIIQSTEESLRNLGVEQIDLQQFHTWTDAWTPTSGWRQAVADLKKSGKVRFIGISITEHEPDTALEAVRTGIIDTVQVIYNIFDQSPEERLFPLCQQMNVGILARVPLDEGGLSGTITEQTQFRPGDFRESYFRGDRKRKLMEHVAALRADLASVEGDARGTLAEIALRFCLSHPAVSTVIPGMRRKATVESSCSLPDQGALPANVLAVLKRHSWRRNYYH
jgi:aryl-alcohol dehydrogenase-like predicted oxidoreductase